MSTASPTLLGILFSVILLLLGGMGYVGKQFLSGGLVPRQTVEDLRDDKAHAIAERDTWRAAYEQAEAARRVEADHREQLLKAGETSIAALRALGSIPAPRPAEVSEGSGVVAS